MADTPAPVGDDFLRLADPYRRELLAHCYRMLGSVHDAEDLVQETYLRAWRAYGDFEERSSLRTWLHRIATRACLTAIEQRGRRPLPTGLGAPSGPDDDLVLPAEVPWLEPVPDALVGAATGDGGSDPAAVVTSRASVRLAFVAALQHLPPRQRAVLLLRDVLKLRAAEVADLLETTTVAVNSILQRARTQLAQVAPSQDDLTEPGAKDQRELLDRYVAAFESKDIPRIVELLTTDVVWEMPPYATWYKGSEAVGRHLELRCPGAPGDIRMVPTAANGQPAFGLYLRGASGDFEPFLLEVLTVTAAGITHVVNFRVPSLLSAFGLPEVVPAET